MLILLHAHPAGPFFLAQMDARATVIFRDFAPQHISVLLWATAKLGHNPGPHLLTAAISTATAEMANFNPQNVANSLWAYATLGFYPGHAFMAAAAHRQLGDMSVSPAAWELYTAHVSPGVCRRVHLEMQPCLLPTPASPLQG